MNLLSALLVTLVGFSAHAMEWRDSEGLTALHRAAGVGDSEQVEKLLKDGADLFALDSKMGVSVLHKAIYSGDAKTIYLLLKSGALVNLQSPSNGNTPLHDAIYFRRGSDLSVIQAILAFKPSLAVKNRAGLTPLDSAKLLNASDMVKVLEKYDRSRQSQKSRKLMDAVRKNEIFKVSNILKAVDPGLLRESDEQGFTPLLLASREGFVEIVGILLKRGADPNQNDQWMGANSGHKAAYWGRAGVMKLLIADGLNINARGRYNGYTPLHDAVSRNHLAVAQILVRAGADLSIKGQDGKTVLDIAVANKNEALIELITKRR